MAYELHIGVAAMQYLAYAGEVADLHATANRTNHMLDHIGL